MQEKFPWMDPSLDPRVRAEKLVAAMTLEQKIAQLHGSMNTINIYALPTADQSALSVRTWCACGYFWRSSWPSALVLLSE